MTNEMDYKTLIPDSLHQQVEELLEYLKNFPFDTPDCCRNCGSKNFYAKKQCSRPDNVMRTYYCNTCKKSFIQLTNTIFCRSTRLEQWWNVGRLYLAGQTNRQIVLQTGISKKQIHSRLRAINKVMQEEYPALHQWWKTHQERTDLSFSTLVKRQAATFLNWLDTCINKTDYSCPHCKRKLYKRNHKSSRPDFVCTRCNYYFNALTETRFQRMLQIELWIPYAKILIDGYGGRDAQKLIGLAIGTAWRWEKTFIAQMQDLGLDELVQWLTWQRNRRYAHVSRDRQSRLDLERIRCAGTPS